MRVRDWELRTPGPRVGLFQVDIENWTEVGGRVGLRTKAAWALSKGGGIRNNSGQVDTKQTKGIGLMDSVEIGGKSRSIF